VVKLHGIQNYKSNSDSSSNASSDKLTCMSNYCSSNSKVISCRRSFLLQYFDESITASLNDNGSSCCDLCQSAYAHTSAFRKASTASSGGSDGWISTTQTNTSEIPLEGSIECEKIDLGHEVLLFLRAVQECGGYFGLSAAVGIVTGSKDKSLHKISGVFNI
jgi:hypothetical protein